MRTISDWPGKSRTLVRLWKFSYLGEATSFLDHVYFGCTQRECHISKDIVDTCRNMFESRISAGATEKLPETKATEKPDANTISSWPCDMEGHAKKFVERHCELAIKNKLSNYTKSQRHAWMIIISKKKNWNPWENLQKHALKLFWHVYFWHVLGGLIFLWSVNKLARAVTKGQKLVTKVWRVWSLTFITHVNTGNIVMWEK